MAKSFVEEIEKQRKEQDAIYHNVAVKFGLSDTAMWILYFVSDKTMEYTQQDLCRMSYCAKQTVNTAINGLVKKGFVVLESADGSRKQKKIVLTDRGREVTDATTDKLKAAEEKTFRHFTDGELKSYLEMTARITAFLREETEQIN